MNIGDFVKGLPSATEHYGITTEKMTRGLVTAVSENEITVKVLEHTDGGTGAHRVDPKCFEVIGHVKPFDRAAVIKLIADGCAKDILNYDLSGANLSRADLSGANLDFSCWPLWFGSLGVKVCKRIACQLAYHFCRLECDDAEYIQARKCSVAAYHEANAIITKKWYVLADY